MILKTAGIRELRVVLEKLVDYGRWGLCTEPHCKTCDAGIEREVEGAFRKIVLITGVQVESK